MKLLNSIATPSWIAGFKVIVYRCKKCNRSLALGRMSARRAGIKMRENWFCSSRCFTLAAEEEISELLKAGHEQADHVSRMPLGLSLISRGLLTSTQLKEVVDEQKEVGGDIGELLVRHGAVSEKQVTTVRATQWGCPVFSVPKHGVQSAIDIPLGLMSLCSATPLHYVAATKVLLVGFVQSIEYGLLYAIEQMTGCKTQPCFITPSDFQSQLQKTAQFVEESVQEDRKEVKIEGVQTAAEISRLLCSYGIALEADEAVIVKCKDYVWARLKSGLKEVDLLFKAG
jgi:hypothetical protein